MPTQLAPNPIIQLPLKWARVRYGDMSAENMIFHGDNIEVLPSLLRDYEGKIRCVYIDPPYNTQERFGHFGDRLTHQEWSDMMRPRLEYLSQLLAENGSLWISIDDNEVHHLRVLLDDIVGPKCYVATIVWEHRTTRENRKTFSSNHEYILVYAKKPSSFRRTRNGLPLSPEVMARYKNPDNDERGPWQSISANVQAGHATPSQLYRLKLPNGKTYDLPPGRCWVFSQNKMLAAFEEGRIWLGKSGRGVPRIKKYLSESANSLTPETLWRAHDVGTTDHAKKHLLSMFPGEAKVFDTPKPESLIRRILEIATDPDDIVLDAFLGSGTTAAVAHKLGRKYIGIEIGSHAKSLSAERLRMVVEGEPGGISADVGWYGGGGVHFIKFSR